MRDTTNSDDPGTRDSESRTIQAGAIVFRADGGSPRILLVRARKSPDAWVFPKGHLQAGESLERTALREAAEECGITGVVLGPAGRPLEFVSDGEPVRVHYFLVYARTDSPSPEGREKQWCSFADAHAQLSHAAARTVLDAARPEIEWWTTPGARQSPEGDRFRDLMIAEFEHVAASLLSNEESGEKRVSAFLAVSGVVGSALGFLIGESPFDVHKQIVAIFVLAVLLLFGYGTFRRIVVRNVASDRYKRRLNRVRQFFLSGPDDRRRTFLPFEPFEHAWRRPAAAFSLGNGGWFETMALVNGVIAGALAAMLLWSIVRRVFEAGADGPAIATILSTGFGVIVLLGTWWMSIRRGNALYVAGMRQRTSDVGYDP